MVRRRSTSMVAGAVILAAVGAVLTAASSRTFAHRSAPALPDYGRLPDFSLTAQDGQPITRGRLLGSVWIADFIFTRCAGQCPLMSAQMAKLQQAFGGAPGVRLVSFSVDPSHDTPEILSAYAARSGVAADRWVLVTEAGNRRGNPVGDAKGTTGPLTTVAVLARQGFHLGLGEGGSPEEPITHSVRLVLVDQRGAVRGYYDATEAEAMRRLQDDARALLRQDP